MTDNIIKCTKCKAPLISEELDAHECFTKCLFLAKFYATTGNYYFYDGKKWYRWFPKSADLLQVDIITSSDEDVTEPYIERYIKFQTVVKVCLIQNVKCMYAFQKNKLAC